MGCQKLTYHQEPAIATSWKIFTSGKEKTVSTSNFCIDYYTGGMIMPGRSGNETEYRYGAANGQEKVDEIAGSGNHYTAQYWEYDSRLMRRWNPDPVVKPHESPYATFANNPIWFSDPLGADSTQRANAVSKANEYVKKNNGGAGNSYDLGSKGGPGEDVDCSGLVSTCIVAGGENDPVKISGSSNAAIDVFGKDGGARRIGAMTKKVANNEDIQVGNAILLSEGGHIGIITKVELDDDGEIETLKFIDSGGDPSSGVSGPRNSYAVRNGKKQYWGKRVKGIYKWDTKPDKTKKVSSSQVKVSQYKISQQNHKQQINMINANRQSIIELDGAIKEYQETVKSVEETVRESQEFREWLKQEESRIFNK